MIGAIIGDIVGSVYEWNNIKTKDFPFINKKNEFTDDSVMTIAVGKALTDWNRTSDIEKYKDILIDTMHNIGNRYPDCGYGGMFSHWVRERKRTPYGSWGNGSAMRVSPCGDFANSLEEAEELAKATAEVTHNHPDGIKGAQATAAAVYLAKTGKNIPEIRKYVEENYYSIDFTLDEIRADYKFESSCLGTVPYALEAFFESEDYEDAIRNAISIGGDSDTLAAICGGIAGAYYEIGIMTKSTTLYYLDSYLSGLVAEIEPKLSMCGNVSAK